MLGKRLGWVKVSCRFSTWAIDDVDAHVVTHLDGRVLTHVLTQSPFRVIGHLDVHVHAQPHGYVNGFLDGHVDGLVNGHLHM